MPYLLVAAFERAVRERGRRESEEARVYTIPRAVSGERKTEVFLSRDKDLRSWGPTLGIRGQGVPVIHNIHSPNLMICNFYSRELNNL